MKLTDSSTTIAVPLIVVLFLIAYYFQVNCTIRRMIDVQ
jgi:uncharacterized membrane protein YdbT with pleckstrin-like domain